MANGFSPRMMEYFPARGHALAIGACRPFPLQIGNLVVFRRNLLRSLFRLLVEPLTKHFILAPQALDLTT